ncbi:pentatricopeptide repeat-containing protein [Tanacetum coccineum]
MMKWSSDMLLFPLCDKVSDSHNHLFFKCDFSARIWGDLRKRITTTDLPDEWDQIIQEMGNFKNSRSIWNILKKIGIASCVYYVWKERNDRIFSTDKKTHCQVLQSINESIRLHLMSLTIKNLLIGYCDDEKMDDAMLVYHEMNEKDFKPNWVTYNIMIRSCFKAARFADAHTLLDELFAQGQTLGQVTYSKILHDLFLHYRFEEAFSLFHLLGDNSKVNSHLYVVHDLMYGAIRCGKLDIASELFEGLSVKRLNHTSFVYTMMIGGFCAEGLLNDEKQLFLEMEENFCLPTDNTYNFLL